MTNCMILQGSAATRLRLRWTRFSLLLMYDVYHGTTPAYFTELCRVCNDERLRSTQRGNFAVVRTRTKLADGSFTLAGPAA